MSGPAPTRSTAPAVVLATTILVFASVVGFVTWRLRAGLREQVLQREAATLTEVAALQLTTEAEALAKLGVADAPGELLNAVLRTSRLRGVFAVRVFDADRRFNGAVPVPWSDEPPMAVDWSQLQAGEPIARLHTRESVAEVIGLAPPGEATGPEEPVVEAWLPLRRADGNRFMGAAQLWLDGRAVAREFSLTDQRLLWQALLAWLAGAVIICVLVGWAFENLAKANRQLAVRGDELLRANRELTLAAKTSALGAIAAHLVHELKNPVGGLEEFIALQNERGDPGSDLAAATELTQRLRTMINDVVGVMRDEEMGAGFELTPAEIVSLVSDRASSLGSSRGVTVIASTKSERALPARRANLVALILYNLVQNAIEASPAGAQVELAAADRQRALVFTVADHGPGLPEAIRVHLFQPSRSTKRGGSGLGLSLSQQLARQAGGRIELTHTDASGTAFELVLDLADET